MEATKEIQAQLKREAPTPAEQTTAGQVFTPAVDIFETDRSITLLADMPGVEADNVTIDLQDDTLILRGNVTDELPQGMSPLFVEYETGAYVRQFSLPEVIDQSRIEAKMENGVLRLVLPKIEKATPRKITVTSS
jgi:HSP20 family molecular chaperone IbpA